MNRVKNKTLLGAMITLSGSFLYVVFGIISKHVQHSLSFNHLIFLYSISGLLLSIIVLGIKKPNWKLLLEEFHFIYVLRILINLSSG